MSLKPLKRNSPELLALRREIVKKARAHRSPFPFWKNPKYTNQALVDWMVEHDVDVNCLSERTGISGSTLYHALRGDGITTHTANCITKATGLQYESLFGDN